MSLRFRHLRLRAQTSSGLFGADVDFPDGLVLLRANNTMGKSTLVNAIAYALAIEQVFGPRKEIPLPPSMLSKLQDDHGNELDVLQSDVYLEIENGKGESLTIRRGAAGTRDRRLMTVWYGPQLTKPATHYQQEDLYTELSGAAQSKAGFDHRLAQFIGWELPAAPRFNGSVGPLYTQCIFPFLFVEQKRGWSSIGATIPRFLQIRDMAERSVEFLLDLDVSDIAASRQELFNKEQEVQRRWGTRISDIRAALSSIGATITELPARAVAQWPPEIDPAVYVQLSNREAVLLTDLIRRHRSTLQELESTIISTVGDVAENVANELSAVAVHLDDQQAKVTKLFKDVQATKADNFALEERLTLLSEDIRHYQDLTKLRNLGSTMELKVTSGECPTCHQRIAQSLLAQTDPEPVMSLDQNLAFLKEQRKTFEQLLRIGKAELVKREQIFVVGQETLRKLQSRVRTLRATLVQDDRAPSLADVQARVALSTEVDRLSSAAERTESLLQGLAELAEEYRSIQSEIAALPESKLSDEDKVKRTVLEASLQEQELEYGFSSFEPGLLHIDETSFTPTREGFNLGFDVSASDGIRLIWGYLLAHLELARSHDTNHPGFVIFDEPQQHKPGQADFAKFLQKASVSKDFAQQVIIATSEESDVLRQLCGNVPYSLISFEGRTLRQIS